MASTIPGHNAAHAFRPRAQDVMKSPNVGRSLGGHLVSGCIQAPLAKLEVRGRQPGRLAAARVRVVVALPLLREQLPPGRPASHADSG